MAGIAVTAAVAAALYLFAGKGTVEKDAVQTPLQSRPVKYMTVAARNAGGKRTFPGKVVASQKVDLAFRVSGQIIELPSVKGVYVEEGTLLARLDPRDFQIQLANAKNELGNARAQLDAMRAGARKEEVAMLSSKVESARAQMNDALTTMDRVEKLYKAGGFSRAEYDKARTSYQVARSAYQSASQELARAVGARPEDIAAMEYTVRGIEGRVAAAENALKDTELRAPFGGVVVERYADNNQSVQKDQLVVSLQDLGSLEVSISVSERLVALARRDVLTRAAARFSTLPDKRIPLTYREASASADPQTQTYLVTFSLQKPEEITVLPGMTVTSSSPASTRPRPVLWKCLPKRSSPERERSISGGNIGHGSPESHGGSGAGFRLPGRHGGSEGELAPGDRIVTAGVSFLQEGDPVTLYEGPRR